MRSTNGRERLKVNASGPKAWPNVVESTPTFSTCVYGFASPGFRENNGNLMHTFFDCTILTVSIKSLFAGATVRPWGILTVRIDITDETITTLIYIYKNRSNAYQNRFINREFKQTTTAGATTAAVTEKVWGEYVSVVGQILAKRNTKMSET